MPCPICDRTMQRLGMNDRIFWCGSCGTLKECSGDIERITMPGDLQHVLATARLKDGEPGILAVRVVQVSYFVGLVDGQHQMVEMIVHSPDGTPLF